MATITAASTLAFSLSPLEVALERISAYGFPKVELSDQITHSQHYGVDTVDPVEVKRLLDRHGLEPVAVNACLIAVFATGAEARPGAFVERQSGAETEEIRAAKKRLKYFKLHEHREADAYIDRAQRLIRKAAITGIPRVCLQGGRRRQIEDVEAELRAAAAVIDDLAAYAGERGIQVLLEMPHVWDLYYDVENAKRMLSNLRSANVGVLIDATHWHTSGYDIDAYVRFLGDRLWHVHLRDAAGRDTPAGSYELEKTPGKGEVDFGHLGETLDKYGYQGDVTLETEYKDYADPDEVDAENRYALAHLRRVGWDVGLRR